MLKSAKEEGNLAEKFGGSIDDLMQRYPVNGPPTELDDQPKKLARQTLCAGLVYQLGKTGPHPKAKS